MNGAEFRARWARSKRLRDSFERAIAARTTRAAVLAVHRDIEREPDLMPAHRVELRRIANERLRWVKE